MKTYPEMNADIVNILSLAADPMCQYTAARIEELEGEREELRVALGVVLDQADYTSGNCRGNEAVGAVLSRQVIALARAALAQTKGDA